MKKKNILASLALLFLTEYLPAMELDPDPENIAEKHQKRKAVGPLDKRDLKKVKLEAFLEEEEEASTQQIIQTEEPNDNELYFNWDSLPDEIQLFILSFLINTHNVITSENDKQSSAQFKQYALLKLVNQKMNHLVSDKQLFDLTSIIAHLIRIPVQKNRLDYLKKILNNAAKYDCINIIKVALESGLEITEYASLLTNASRFKNIKLCKKLILWGIIKFSSNITLIHAIFLHDIERIKTLIASKKSTASLTGESTELMIASKVDNIDILSLLLNANPKGNINTRNHRGKTALHYAAKKNDIKAVQFLLVNHAIVEIRDYKNRTPLWLACARENIEIVRLLFNNASNAKTSNIFEGQSALYIALNLGNMKIAQLLLYNGAINAKNQYGQTPLWTACMNNNIEMAQFLLYSGANTEAKDAFGKTPLWTACKHNNIEIAQLLLDSGADIETKDRRGRTVLYQAVLKHNIKAMQFLLDKHANTEIKNTTGQTSLCIACEHGITKIVQLLLDSGANIGAKDVYGQTPVDIATRKGHISIVQLLYEKAQLLIKQISQI